MTQQARYVAELIGAISDAHRQAYAVHFLLARDKPTGVLHPTAVMAASVAEKLRAAYITAGHLADAMRE